MQPLNRRSGRGSVGDNRGISKIDPACLTDYRQVVVADPAGIRGSTIASVTSSRSIVAVPSPRTRNVSQSVTCLRLMAGPSPASTRTSLRTTRSAFRISIPSSAAWIRTFSSPNSRSGCSGNPSILPAVSTLRAVMARNSDVAKCRRFLADRRRFCFRIVQVSGGDADRGFDIAHRDVRRPDPLDSPTPTPLRFDAQSPFGAVEHAVCYRDVVDTPRGLAPDCDGHTPPSGGTAGDRDVLCGATDPSAASVEPRSSTTSS